MGLTEHTSTNAFSTGKYHRSFGKKNIHPLRQTLLRAFYRTSLRLIDKQGWPDPLAKEMPCVLLCGTASPYTTTTFVRFVRARNSAANITILDISAYSLSQSEHMLRMCPYIDASNISFVEGNALALPCADASFDWIETDFFLQYFSPTERITLLKEWHRVLKPEGIVTSRDWLWQRHDFIESVVEHTKNWLIRHILDAVACSASLQDIKDIASVLGFDAAFFPVHVPLLKFTLPLMSYILIYKSTTNVPVKRLDHP